MATKTAAGRLALRHQTGGVWQWLHGHSRLAHRLQAVVLSLLGVVVLAQVLYPGDRALPLAYIGGLGVGGQDRAAMMAQFDGFAEQGEVRLLTPSRDWKTKWQEVGLTIDRQASATAALEYSWWERLIPFSSVAKVLQSRQAPLVALIDGERLRAFAEKVVAEDSEAARDAVIAVQDGQIKVDEAKSGYRFRVSEVERQMQALPLVSEASVRLVPEAVPPTRSAAELEALAAQAEAMLTHPLTLAVAGRSYQPDRATIGTWLAFPEDPSTKQLVVSLNQETLRAYLAGLDKEIATQPGVTTVTLLDGQEVGRTPGAPGQVVAVDAAVAAIEQALRTSGEPRAVQLNLAPVPPRVELARTYSQASSGLQALIRDWEAAHYGDFGIIVREISGEKRYAEHQPDKRFVTASTYKMFLAYTVYTKMDEGVISRQQRTDMGWTVDECLKEMILHSTNPCAISLQNMVGWEEVDRMVQGAGFPATMLNNRTGGEKFSTIRDETNFMLRVHSKTLMSEPHSDELLGMFKRQVWRGGIPSGVPRGTVVADKVGFYNGWVHDVGVVYGPKSTYILGIMSKGGSDPQFADLSRRVYNFFNQ